jgi:hypothetical protein
MKTIFLGLFGIILSVCAFAQDLPIDATSKKITYSESVDVADVKSSVFYSRIEAWAKAKKYELPTTKQPMVFKCKGLITTTYPSVKIGMQETGTIAFDLTVLVKDGKYKYTITNVRHEGIKGRASGGPLETAECAAGRQAISNAGWLKIKADAADMIPKAIEEMKIAMTGSSTPSSGNAAETW